MLFIIFIITNISNTTTYYYFFYCTLLLLSRCREKHFIKEKCHTEMLITAYMQFYNIDALQHTSLKQAGIYVRNVLPDTPAALCGAIRVGDRILAVNGKSIVGTDYQRLGMTSFFFIFFFCGGLERRGGGSFSTMIYLD